MTLFCYSGEFITRFRAKLIRNIKSIHLFNFRPISDFPVIFPKIQSSPS